MRTGLFKIFKDENGTWLILRTKTGLQVFLNIESAAGYLWQGMLLDEDNICRRAVQEWCAEVNPTSDFHSANEVARYESEVNPEDRNVGVDGVGRLSECRRYMARDTQSRAARPYHDRGDAGLNGLTKIGCDT